MQSIKQIGFLLNHLGPSQLAFYVINQINAIGEKTVDYDFVLFYEHLVKPCVVPNCMVLNATETFSFHGLLIATTLDNAEVAINSINTARNIYYIWDLDWMRRGQNNYIKNISILRNPKLELIARSQDHASAIENYCNRKVSSIISDANIAEIDKLCLQKKL